MLFQAHLEMYGSTDTHVHAHTYTTTYIHMHVSVYVYLYMYIYMYMYMYIDIDIHIYKSASTYKMHMHMHVHLHTHLHVHLIIGSMLVPGNRATIAAAAAVQERAQALASWQTTQRVAGLPLYFCCCDLGVLFVTVLIMRAVLFGVYMSAPSFLET